MSKLLITAIDWLYSISLLLRHKGKEQEQQKKQKRDHMIISSVQMQMRLHTKTCTPKSIKKIMCTLTRPCVTTLKMEVEKRDCVNWFEGRLPSISPCVHQFQISCQTKNGHKWKTLLKPSAPNWHRLDSAADFTLAGWMTCMFSFFLQLYVKQLKLWQCVCWVLKSELRQVQ